MVNTLSFAFDRQFPKASELLRSFVAAQYQKSISREEADAALSDHFDTACFKYAWNYFNQKSDLDWHVIALDPDVQEHFQCEANVVLRSISEAYAWLLLNCDQSRIFPTAAKIRDDGAVSFWVREREIAVVSRIRFSSVEPEKAKRVEQAFKGIRTFGDEARLKAKLAKIPGLDNVKLPERKAPHRVGATMLRTPANLCTQVETMLRDRFGIELKHAQACELTAGLFGAESWNHFVAHNDKALCRLLPVVLIPQGEKNVLFFRSAGEAIWAFGQRNMQVLPVRPTLIRAMILGEGPGVFMGDLGGLDKPDPNAEWWLGYYEDLTVRESDYLALGSLLAEADDIGAKVRALYEGEPRAAVTGANRRLGWSKELEAGKWVFSFMQNQLNPSRTLMMIESLDELGKKGDPVITSLHKTVFRSAGDQVQLYGQYGADLLLEAEWPAALRKQFSELTRLHEHVQQA